MKGKESHLSIENATLFFLYKENRFIFEFANL